MAGFDDLIRGALEKQGNPTTERRSAIYNSSRQALERMLASNTTLDEKAIALQRQRLEKAILDIETSYTAQTAQAPAPTQAQTQTQTPTQQAAAAPAAAQPAPRPAPTPAPAQTQAPMPRTNVPPAPEQKSAPEVSISVGPGSRVPPVPAPPAASHQQAPPARPSELSATRGPIADESLTVPPPPENEAPATRLEDHTENYRGDILRERKPYAKMLLWTIILVGIAVAIWWAITFGPALLKQKLDGSVPNPAGTIQSGAFVPDGDDGWVTAFSPESDAQNIETEGRGTADLFQEGSRTFLRMTSSAGSTRNNLKIKMPRGIMQSIQGKAATFELIIKNPAEATHQFAVFCDFAAMGDCGRKRFKVNKMPEAFIFDVLVNNVALPQDENAYLSIHSDLSSGGKPIDLYSIRVRPGE